MSCAAWPCRWARPADMARRPDQALLDRFAAIVGERQALREPADQEPYLVEWRDKYHGTTPMVLRPESVEEVAAILALADATGTPIVPQGGNTGLVGGQIPHDTGTEIVLSLQAARPDPRRRSRRRLTIDVEAGVTLQRAAGGGRARRPPVPALARLGGHLHHRRQYRDQCRRHGGARLRQHARPRARARGGAAGRPDLERPAPSAQGQHRLRPEEPLHRLGGHARHRHRGRAEAVSAAALGRDGASSRVPDPGGGAGPARADARPPAGAPSPPSSSCRGSASSSSCVTIRPAAIPSPRPTPGTC